MGAVQEKLESLDDVLNEALLRKANEQDISTGFVSSDYSPLRSRGEINSWQGLQYLRTYEQSGFYAVFHVVLEEGEEAVFSCDYLRGFEKKYNEKEELPKTFLSELAEALRGDFEFPAEWSQKEYLVLECGGNKLTVRHLGSSSYEFRRGIRGDNMKVSPVTRNFMPAGNGVQEKVSELVKILLEKEQYKGVRLPTDN